MAQEQRKQGPEEAFRAINEHEWDRAEHCAAMSIAGSALGCKAAPAVLVLPNGERLARVGVGGAVALYAGGSVLVVLDMNR